VTRTWKISCGCSIRSSKGGSTTAEVTTNPRCTQRCANWTAVWCVRAGCWESRVRRQQRCHTLQEVLLHCAVAEVFLPMHLLVERQIAPTHRQRRAQQVQRPIGLQVRPVDQDQGLADARQQHPAQRRVDRSHLVLKVPVAKQAVGALDSVPKRRRACEAPTHSVSVTRGPLTQDTTAANSLPSAGRGRGTATDRGIGVRSTGYAWASPGGFRCLSGTAKPDAYSIRYWNTNITI